MREADWQVHAFCLVLSDVLAKVEAAKRLRAQATIDWPWGRAAEIGMLATDPLGSLLLALVTGPAYW